MVNNTFLWVDWGPIFHGKRRTCQVPQGQSHWHHGACLFGIHNFMRERCSLLLSITCFAFQVVQNMMMNNEEIGGSTFWDKAKKISGWWYVQKYGSESDWMPSCLLCLLGLPWPQLTTTDHNNCLNHMFWPNTWPCTISYSHTEIRAQTFDSWSSGWGGSWRKPHFLPRFDWRRCHQRLWSGSDLAREESNAKWHWFFSHATNPGPWWLNAACALTRFLWGTSATIKHGRFVYRLLRCLE